MKLKNKKTGEIVDARMSYREDTAPIVVSETTCDENGQSQGWPYNSLAELCEEWCDAEEPKEFWYITALNGVIFTKYMEEPFTGEEEKKYKEIGNYFETKEEAEKAVAKLKAFKRLKDKGFRFGGQISKFEDDWHVLISAHLKEWDTETEKDLNLLFSEEENNRADTEYEIQAHDAELRALLKSMERKIPACREMSIVKTKLEEASMWLCLLQEEYLAKEEKQWNKMNKH